VPCAEAGLKLGLGQEFGGEEDIKNQRMTFCCPEELKLRNEHRSFEQSKKH
jgi:hypothetical protein